MKFENGGEQKLIEEKKKRGEKLSFIEQYQDCNRQEVPAILEKRKNEFNELKIRQEEKLRKLKEEIGKGRLVYKK